MLASKKRCRLSRSRSCTRMCHSATHGKNPPGNTQLTRDTLGSSVTAAVECIGNEKDSAARLHVEADEDGGVGGAHDARVRRHRLEVLLQQRRVRRVEELLDDGGDGEVPARRACA